MNRQLSLEVNSAVTQVAYIKELILFSPPEGVGRDCWSLLCAAGRNRYPITVYSAPVHKPDDLHWSYVREYLVGLDAEWEERSTR